MMGVVSVAGLEGCRVRLAKGGPEDEDGTMTHLQQKRARKTHAELRGLQSCRDVAKKNKRRLNNLLERRRLGSQREKGPVAVGRDGVCFWLLHPSIRFARF